MSLRLRLALFFAAAVGVALILFAGTALLVVATESKTQGADADEMSDDIGQLLRAMAISAPIAIAGAAALGYGLAKRALKPLREASARARAAHASELDLTLPVGTGGEEWDDLAGTLNSLLSDARGSLSRIRHFTADAAHELRTPLTAIIGTADVALRKERSNDELRTALGDVREESARLARVVEALLTLARADSKQLLAARTATPLAQLARDAMAQAGAQPGALELSGEPSVECDPVLLVRALRNLVENGLTHGGGAVHVAVGPAARVVVRDEGPGIDPALLPQLFQRFRRGDASRSTEGIGLGLALARAIVEAHGGSLKALPAAKGAAFEVLLPAAT